MVDDLRIEFTMKSQSLPKEDLDYIDAIDINAQNELRVKEAEYERYRPQRIDTKEQELLRHYRNEIQAPRPSWAPPPRMPSRDAIKAEATRIVDESHRQTRQSIIDEASKAKQDRVVRSLEKQDRELKEAAERKMAERQAKRAQQRDRGRER